MKWLVIAVLGALLAVSSVSPARATLFTATIAPANQAYNGGCPGTLTFTGTITGTPGTALTYQFFGNGGAANGATLPGTIPASGSLTVTDTPSVDKPNEGSWHRQLLAKAGAQLIYSGVANYSVTCTTIVPGPTPPPGGGRFHARVGTGRGSAAQLVYGIPMPENLKNTTDPQVCGSHGGLAGLFCIQAVPDKYLILVWDWHPNDKWPSIDGYHVYNVTGGGKTLDQTVTNPQQTLEFFKPGTYGSKCYAVAAFKGGTESVLSESFCTLGARIGVNSKALHMFRWAYKVHTYSGCGAMAGLCVTGTRCDDLCFGFFHSLSGSGLTLNHINEYWRAYLQFDPAQISGLNVYKAQLKLRVASGKPECFGAIGVADGPAWDTQDMTDAVWENVPTAVSGAGAEFDVTNIVRSWAQGAPNWGFAFKGTDETTGADENASCMLDFGLDATLGISYY